MLRCQNCHLLKPLFIAVRERMIFFGKKLCDCFAKIKNALNSHYKPKKIRNLHGL